MNTQALFSTLVRTKQVLQGQTVWQGRVDMAVLRALFCVSSGIARNSKWVIHLPDKKTVILRTNHIEPSGNKGRIWYGEIPSHPDVQAILVAHHWDSEFPPVSGHIQIGAVRFLLIHARGNRVNIIRLPADHVNVCGIADSVANLEPSVPKETTTLFRDDEPNRNSPVIITILPVYGAAMIKSYSADAIQGVCMTAQAYTNKALVNSGIEARTLYLEPVYLDELKNRKAMQSFDIFEKNGKTGHPNDPLYIAVNTARDNAKADLVLMLFSTSDGCVAGMASNIPEPPSYDKNELSNACFSVGGTTNPAVFAHEFGRLLEGKHDRFTMLWSFKRNSVYDYVGGYVSASTDDTAPFVTLLGYPGALQPRSEYAVGYAQAYSAAERKWHGKPLGNLINQSDAATLFRLSTRVVAAYKGSEAVAMHVANLQHLDLQVQPSLGGALIPSFPGPYAEGSVVTIKAQSRVGYRFDHWTLDNINVPRSRPVAYLVMHCPHSLKAHFISTGENHTVNVRAWIGQPYDSSGKDSPKKELSSDEFSVTMIPPGPYPPGTHVTAQVTIRPADGSKHSPYCWTIDDDLVDDPFNICPTNQSRILKLKIEKDIALGCYFYPDK